MDTKQLDLFQFPGEHEAGIFEQAKLAKKTVQALYNNLELGLPVPKDLLTKSYAILKLEINIDLVGDSEINREPNSPRAFIWQFIYKYKLKIDNEEILINSDSRSKVIKAWFNALYTSKNFSQNEFLSIASQYFTLEVLTNTLSDEKFIKEIEENIGKLDLIICFDYKLFPPSIAKPVDLMKDDIFKKVNNFYKKLLQLQKENWYLIGIYDSFVEQNSFLRELDNNAKVKEKRQLGIPKKMKYRTFNEIFQNDFLFLNNIAFINKMHNTHGWNTYFIIPPQYLNDDFTQIDESKLYNGINSREKKEIYLYFKKRLDSSFSRADISIPDKLLESIKLKELLTIVHELK